MKTEEIDKAGLNVTIRAFKAVNEKETCLKFLEGHVKVLKDYGISNVTTNNTLWIDNPSIYVVVAECKENNNELLGGVRVHVADGRLPLPLEAAIGRIDGGVYKLIKEYIDEGTGELCALWNSKIVAGYGLSLLLIRAGISVVNQVSLSSLFTICADYTMPMVKKVGFVIEESVGNGGGFVYPNENYIAKVLRKMNAEKLDTAEEYDRERILNLRKNPEQKFPESGPKGIINVNYQLRINLQ